jgi:hypothetical protein
MTKGHAMPRPPSLRYLAAAAMLAGLAVGAAADPLVIDGDGTVRLGGAEAGIVVDPAGAVRVGPADRGLAVHRNGIVNLGSASAPPLIVGGESVLIRSNLSFGSSQGTKLILYDPGTAIGVQNSTLYFRSYGNFAWFNRGSHADEKFAPGEGGTTLMSLASSPDVGRGTLDVAGGVSAKSLDLRAATRTDVHPTPTTLYVTGDIPDGRPTGSAAPGIEFRHSNGTQGIGFGYNTIYATGADTDQPLRLEARGASNVTIGGNGRLEVPGELLLGHGWRVQTNNDTLTFSRNGDIVMMVNQNERLQYKVPGIGLYYLGRSGGWATWDSDARLKADVAAIPSAMARVRDLRGVTFLWNDRARARDAALPAGRQVGVIAQEVEAALPEAVSVGADGYKAVQYRDLIPLLIEALKEQDRAAAAQADRIAVLDAELADLRGRLDDLAIAAAAPATN